LLPGSFATAGAARPRSSAHRFHLGDLGEHLAFPVRLGPARAAPRGRLQLLGAAFTFAAGKITEIYILADRARLTRLGCLTFPLG